MDFGTIKWGWKRDSDDARDFVFQAPSPRIAFPPFASVREWAPPIKDQLNLGSCTAQALCGAYETLMHKNRGHSVDFSRLFLYYEERKIEGSIDDDSGAMIRDGCKALNKVGCCFEINWPYDISKFRTEPEFGCYAQAEQFQAIEYFRLNNRSMPDLLNCLADGFSFVGGVEVFESMMTHEVQSSGVVPMPGLFEQTVGGHALHFVEYDLTKRVFRGPNSWGSDWGQEGFFEMPFAYVAKYGGDFWTIRKVEVIGSDV